MSTESVPRLLHEAFARAARRHPAGPAVDVPAAGDGGARVVRTFAALAADAERVTAALGPDRGERVVAILLARDTPWLYAAQLGVLQAGAAHLCLEPRYPDEHLRLVLEDAQVASVLTDARGAARVRGLGLAGLQVHDVDQIAGAPAAGLAVAPFAGDADRLAYVIYTSGTTGRPKGVMIEHRSIVNLVLSDLAEFGLGPGDRVAQGSSPAYDSAVEETWLALAAGATLVPMSDEVVRRGPDLVPWLRDERITVLCPPPTLLRATGCREPAVALPDLRLCYVGGEALPAEIAARWAAGRRMVNGYGPTECTVTVTRAEVAPGQDVTIGAAVPGNRALVLDQQLREVADGEWGELCIAGTGLARGYLGQPERTAERFVNHPQHGRIYRTGDRVRRGGDGALRYGGRLDDQVKLRGHRVELGEIEARLVGSHGVQQAACAVQQGDVLVAFLVADAPGHALDVAAVAATLRSRLPSHMVPAHFAQIDALPTSVGGKLDRKALSAVRAAAAAASPGGRPPHGALEQIVAAAWCEVLELRQVPADVDFFTLGGNSLRAAELISRLRAVERTAALTVRDVYEARTVAALALQAARAAGEGGAVAADRPEGPPAGQHPLLVAAAQAAWLLAELLLVAPLAWFAVFVVLPFVTRFVDPIVLLCLGPFVGTALGLLLLAPALGFALAIKRLLVGRYRAGREPVYGWWHLRHWITAHCVRLVPWGLLQGTELQLALLRWLGAKIGRDVHVHRGVDLLSGGWDLLEIGDGVSLGQDAALGVCELDRGHVVTAPVTLGPGAVLETRAGVDGGTHVGEGACIGALSHVAAGARVPAGERWDGVPARCVGRVAEPGVVDRGGAALPPWRHDLLLLALRTSSTWLAFLPLLALVAALAWSWGGDGAALRAWLESPSVSLSGLLQLLVAIVIAVPLGLAMQAALLRLGPRIPQGVLRTRSALHVLALERARIVEAAGLWLSGTLFWPAWLRLAGARIGPQCEVSTIVDVLPEQVTLGARCFFADGIYLGGPRIDRGTVTVAPVRFGEDTFLGNHVVIPPATELAGDSLLGVCTVADGARMTRGTSWFGHPAFLLPRREVVEIDRHLTFEPGPLRFANRVCWEALRCCVPIAPAVALLAWLAMVAAAPGEGPLLLVLVAATATFAVAVGLAVFVLMLKWALLGRVRPGQHGLWSCWCSRWDFLYVAWGMLARGVLARLGGTLWLAWYLRAMGVRVGRRVVLGPGFAQVVDPDMLRFGDDATIDTMFQAHSFEDRVLKIDRVTIGPGATLRRASVVLYGAELGERCTIAPHSVVMKNERMLPHRRYVGAPTRPESS